MATPHGRIIIDVGRSSAGQRTTKRPGEDAATPTTTPRRAGPIRVGGTMPTEPPGVGLARPLPDPDELTRIDDPKLRQRAIEGWRNASRLRRLLDQWSAWFSGWESRGDADPGFALDLHEACRTCIGALRRLGADLPSLRDQTPGAKLEDRLPVCPGGHLLPVPWFQDEQEYVRCVNGWTLRESTSLIGELWIWMASAKASPSTAFVDDILLPPNRHAEQAPSKTKGPPDGHDRSKAIPSSKQPSDAAIQCYRLKFVLGSEKTQAGIALDVYGDRGKQSQVSRDLAAVKNWMEGGNVLPPLDGPKPAILTTDPRNLDKGPPPRGRPKDR